MIIVMGRKITIKMQQAPSAYDISSTVKAVIPAIMEPKNNAANDQASFAKKTNKNSSKRSRHNKSLKGKLRILQRRLSVSQSQH